MTYVPAVAIALGLSFEILALRDPRNVLLKTVATATSLSYLALFIIYKPAGSFTNVWPLGMNIYCLAQRCWNHLWLREPSEIRRHAARRDSGVEMKQNEVNQDLKKAPAKTDEITFADAFEIAISFLGIGWSFQAKGTPALSLRDRERSQFIRSRLLGAVFQYLVLDILITVANTMNPSIASSSFLKTLFLGATMLLYVRYTMDIPCRILSVLIVSSGLGQPTSWPPLFGSWKEAYTVRRFWSHTWHQGMRLLAEPPIHYLADKVFVLPPGSAANKWFRIFGNFFIACLDHAYGRIIAGGNPRSDYVFFAIQPIAILVEENVRGIAIWLGILDAKHRSVLEKWLGYIWTAVFQCFTFLYFMEGAIHIRGRREDQLLIEPAFGFSLFSTLLS
ncbi:hypothetical protein CKM354_000796500 [Cercospora kikuchii]|uniref:Wax synthase domain-containing protein n=1 Tax=Cercospora kikuchii TaxID=84275 RepID=A0A9P3FEU5_9PEZI|nr:uncharacterized protein CKM354_000796500 [Cercospora kikuchii]GIZ44776.1 hypothetical protein CKM354_000796500 [Cercospora kikuchii]